MRTLIAIVILTLSTACADVGEPAEAESDSTDYDNTEPESDGAEPAVHAQDGEPVDACLPGFCCDEVVTHVGSATSWCLGASVASTPGSCPAGASYVSCDSECFAGAGASGACGIGTFSGNGECCS